MDLKNWQWFYRAKVTRVVDADTVDVELDRGFEDSSVKRLRLEGIDAWEVRGVERPLGLVAKDRLYELVNDADVVIETFRDSAGKYGRYLAIIWLGSVNINEQLVKEGHAVPYEQRKTLKPQILREKGLLED